MNNNGIIYQFISIFAIICILVISDMLFDNINDDGFTHLQLDRAVKFAQKPGRNYDFFEFMTLYADQGNIVVGLYVLIYCLLPRD